MRQYTNAFFLSMSKDGSEVILSFLQSSPTLDAHSQEDVTVQKESVSELIMNAETARNLLKGLSATFERHEAKQVKKGRPQKRP